MFSQTLMSITREIRASIPGVKLTDETVLRRNLMFVAQVIKASPGLLLEGLHCLPPEASGFENALKAYYRDHREEELNHYEWLMEDLGETPCFAQIDWVAAELAGSMYYMIKHWHPAALLGYMAVLEGTPTTLDVVAQLEALHGTKLLRTARFHAVEDLEHRKALFALIDMTPSQLQSVVIESAVHTLRLMQLAQTRWET